MFCPSGFAAQSAFGACLKGLLPELSFSDRWSRELNSDKRNREARILATRKVPGWKTWQEQIISSVP